MMKTCAIRADLFRFKIQFWGVVTAAGAVAGVATILGFFGSFHWLLDLCSHFRVQYFLGLTAVALLLVVPRKLVTAAVYGVLAAVNLGVILPFYFGGTPADGSSVPPVRAMLLNVNTGYGKAQLVSGVISRFNPDIVVLEEINTKWLSDLGPALAGHGYSRIQSRDDNFGIALFSRFAITQSRIAYIGDAGVPSIVAEIGTPQGRCTVLATHTLPPAGRDYSNMRNSQLAELPKWIKQAKSPVLLLGDLNVTPWNYYFRRLVSESGLKDSSRGRGVHPSWPTFNVLMRIPIDHCLSSPAIAVVRREIGPKVGSDHFPLIVEFVIGGSNK